MSEETADTTGDCRRSIREAALGLLARREHARLELERKLTGRGHAPELVEGVVADLAAAGLQSDDRFAEVFVRSAVNRGHGPLKIRAGLRERGVDGDAPLTGFGDDEWRDYATMVIGKRFGETPPRDRAEWAKRARFLGARGFSSDVASRVLGRLDELP